MLIEFSKFLVLTISSTLVVSAVNVLNESEKYTNYALSIVGLGELLRIELQLIEQLEKYEEKLLEKLEFMRIVVNDLREEHTKSMNDPILYLSNPINGFALLRRTHDDWVTWHDFVQQLEAQPQIDFIEELKVKMPTEKDVKEANLGIVRIQDTYEISSDDMANGVLYGKQYDARLSALDCYVIGKHLWTELKYDASISWYNASIKLFATHDDVMSKVLGFNEAEIWASLRECLIDSIKYNEAYKAIERSVQLRPNDEVLLEYEAALREFLSLNRLCRNEIPQKSRLHCRYNSTTTPFLKIAPFKMEEIALDPYIVLYHDVVYDREIEELQSLSLPKMERGGVINATFDSDRTTQVWNVLQSDSILLVPLYQRFDDLSGLDWSDAPHMQVSNYGIGGHFDSHKDYYNITMFPKMALNKGDRVAVILLYLSDVEMGGSTAFPNIDVVVHPKKGAALFWYNLDNAGNGNPKSTHASCPMVLGSKWVAVRLAFQWPQMFKEPCHKRSS